MKKNITYLIPIILFAIGCKSTTGITETDTPLYKAGDVINLEEIEIEPEPYIYQASEKRINDLIHTRLEISFDWEKQYLFGKANLTLKPYFYPTDSLILDAKGFDVLDIAIVDESGKQPLDFSYDNKFLKIKLPKEYTREEEYEIYIKYTAKPNELPSGGSDAITSDKGLYFINPNGTEGAKPQQIWTQGETESSSCWFPTIDSPNERMTQELFITVDKEYKTLSNGELIYSNYNEDDTRTDYWTMELPHAPYLAMMAIGDYKMALDKWTNRAGVEIPVNYYIEEEYADNVFGIFGNTPEMMTFYSDLLNYQYPWAKYSQVIVRDYVSGAMENTTATIHGEFLNQTAREMLDGDNEDVISHELFHQWFGDLVTCESWANLPLNESFATYGEYLWNEYKYGLDEAAMKFRRSRDGYFREAEYEKKDMIRFDYKNKDDMFDGHSYNKGGQILHMLRDYVGNEAFFASLSKYLHDNEYQSVEIHNLRLAFEEVTGEDLNWFFNQWFLSAGHPVLDITYAYDEVSKLETITIKQEQDLQESPLFRLPFNIAIYEGNKVSNYPVVLSEKEQSFSFHADVAPSFVNVDSKNVILAEKQDHKPIAWWSEQYIHSTNYLDKYEALQQAKSLSDEGEESFKQMTLDALSDPFWGIKLKALSQTKIIKGYKNTEEVIFGLTKDKKPTVRAMALFNLENSYDVTQYKETFMTALEDQSYNVISYALIGLIKIDPELALTNAKKFEKEKSQSIAGAVGRVYADFGQSSEQAFFQRNLAKTNPDYQLVSLYSNYLARQNKEIIYQGIKELQTTAEQGSPWWIKLGAYRSLNNLMTLFNDQEIEAKMNQEAATDSADKATLDHKIKKLKDLQYLVGLSIEEAKNKETDEKVLGRI